MRAILVTPLLCSLLVHAQLPLPLYERRDGDDRSLLVSRGPAQFDSLRKAIREVTAIGPNGIERMDLRGWRVIHVDECCTTDDPVVLVLELQRPVVRDTAYTAFFPGRVHVAPWRATPIPLDSLWRDTLVLTDLEGRRSDFFFAPDSISGDGLTYRQYDQYTGVPHDRTFATPRRNCTARSNGMFASVRCARDTSLRAHVWGANALFLFQNGKPVLQFWDWTGTGTDGYGPFAHSRYDVCGAIRHGDGTAYVLTSGEVVYFDGARWSVASRPPVLYYGECDCGDE